MGLLGLYLGLAAVAAVGLLRTMQSQSASRRYLESGSQEAPPVLGHLSRPLANLVQEARALRLSLEGQLRQLRALGLLGAIGSDADDLDSQLLEATRGLGEWLAAVERLAPDDRQRLDELSPEAQRVKGLFEAQHMALERGSRRGRPPVVETIDRLLSELEGFEENMQKAHNPYR